MKLSIKSNSVRFRISSEELETLRTSHVVGCETCIPMGNGTMEVMRNEITVLPEAATSDLVLSSRGFSCRLCADDFATLQAPEKEGVYIKRVGRLPDGKALGFVFYVEKDKPKSKDRHKKKHDKARSATAGTSDFGSAVPGPNDNQTGERQL